MSTRHLTVNHQTKISITIMVEDDSGMLAFSLLLMTRLFIGFWQLERGAEKTAYVERFLERQGSLAVDAALLGPGEHQKKGDEE